jgi:hypothetical protein
MKKNRRNDWLSRNSARPSQRSRRRAASEAKAALIKLRGEHPGEFYHIEQRTEEIEP